MRVLRAWMLGSVQGYGAGAGGRSIFYLGMEEIDVRGKVVYYPEPSPLEFECGLVKSGVAGCTGSMSVRRCHWEGSL
jgi:hypothetical protein